MFDYGHFRFESKQALFDKAITYWNPDKTKFWQKAGIDLVIDRREGYCLYDMSGRRLIDLHLNGGTYNLGHRHPELVETLKGALDYFDIGNHWFPSVARAALAESLIKVSPVSVSMGSGVWKVNEPSPLAVHPSGSTVATSAQSPRFAFEG